MSSFFKGIKRGFDLKVRSYNVGQNLVFVNFILNQVTNL